MERLSPSKYHSTLCPTSPAVLLTSIILFCRSVRNETKDKILAIKEKYPHFNPHLAMIQVGNREDSSIYVKMKDKAAKEVHRVYPFALRHASSYSTYFSTTIFRLVSLSPWKSYPNPFLKASF